MTLERLVDRLVQPVSVQEELFNLTGQLGVPAERAEEYIRSLRIALGQDNQPTRTIDYLRFKLEQKQ